MGRGDGPLVFLDFETRSTVDLKTRGGRAYVRDQSTEILCGVLLVIEDGWAPSGYCWAPWKGPKKPRRPEPPGNRPELEGIEWTYDWETDDPHPDALEAVQRGTLVAHNASGFDRVLWEDLEFPRPRRWADSLDLARRASLPGGLDAIGERLFGVGKDVGGHKLMMKHCKPVKAGKGDPNGNGHGQPSGGFLDPAPATLGAILHYCARDVLLLAAAWFGEGLGAPHVDDDVLAVHEAIDARGIPLDLAYARRLADAEERLTGAALAVAESHGVSATVLRSSHEKLGLPGWLKEQGFHVPDVTSGNVEKLLADVEERIAFLRGELIEVPA